MKLVKITDEKIGLFVLLSKGPYAIDIANSLGVFAPHDPLPNGLLNGVLKDGCNWSLLVKHWAHLRSPLEKLARIAMTNPDHPHLVLEPPHARTKSRKRRQPDRRDRYHGHRILRRARSDGPARHGATVHAASRQWTPAERDADRDGDRAGDQLLSSRQRGRASEVSEADL
jgi:hypothetical protein